MDDTINKRMTLKPDGWFVSVNTCPPGAFAFQYGDEWRLGFKSEYRTTNGKVEAFNSAGEFLCIDYDEVPVIPLEVECEELNY